MSHYNLRRRPRVGMCRPGPVTAVTFPWYDQIHVSHDTARQRLWTVARWHTRRGADFWDVVQAVADAEGYPEREPRAPDGGTAPRTEQDQKSSSAEKYLRGGQGVLHGQAMAAVQLRNVLAGWMLFPIWPRTRKSCPIWDKVTRPSLDLPSIQDMHRRISHPSARKLFS